MGLEFLDVTEQLDTALIKSRHRGRGQEDVYEITNYSDSVVDTHLLIVVRGLAGRARLVNASGITSDGDPYVRVYLDDGVLLPEQHIVERLCFRQSSRNAPLNYALELLSGQGNP